MDGVGTGNGFPRKINLHLNVPAEIAVRRAVDEVEKLGADTRLTDAVILLQQAQDKIALYVDDQIYGTTRMEGKV
jgi:hypothetical protein